VYGDRPEIPCVCRKTETRWGLRRSDLPTRHCGKIFRIDQSEAFHCSARFEKSLRTWDGYKNMAGIFRCSTCCLRGGCLTGPEPFGRRAAWVSQLFGEVQLKDASTRWFGYKGQTGAGTISIRKDVAAFMFAFLSEAANCGKVYNLGRRLRRPPVRFSKHLR